MYILPNYGDVNYYPYSRITCSSYPPYPETKIVSMTSLCLKAWRTPLPRGGRNSFNFMQCWGKYGKIVCWRPRGSCRPLLGEILDPPSKTLFDQYSFGASCYQLTAKFQRGSVFSHVGLLTTGSHVDRRRSIQARGPTLTLKPRELP